MRCTSLKSTGLDRTRIAQELLQYVGVLIPEEVDTDRRLEEYPTPSDLDNYASCVMYTKAREISDELQGVATTTVGGVLVLARRPWNTLSSLKVILALGRMALCRDSFLPSHNGSGMSLRSARPSRRDPGKRRRGGGSDSDSPPISPQGEAVAVECSPDGTSGLSLSLSCVALPAGYAHEARISIA
jgi:hypothetical protein